MSDDGHTDLESMDELSRTLAKVDDPDLIQQFFECLLTPSEIHEMASRWALVKLIDEGWSQRAIAQELGLSLCKITRGSRELKKENSAFARMIHISRTSGVSKKG